MNTLENKTNNIAFKGIYGYMTLRFIGFCFIVFSQIALSILLFDTALLLEGDFTAFENLDENLIGFLFQLSNVGKPIIMCSMFALIFEKSKKIINAVIFYFLMSSLFYLGEVLVFNYILEPFILTLLNEYHIDISLVEELFPMIKAYASSYANLNIFLDMFLCTLMYMFIAYTPKFIKGKWKYFYRSLSIIPIGYVIASYVLTILKNFHIINLNSIEITALMVKDSPMFFIIFLALICFVKIRKNKYEKENNSLSYEEYLKTSSYTFSYSLFLAIILIVVSLIDRTLLLVPYASNFEVGNNLLLFLAVPFVLLYNVSKTKYKRISKIALPAFISTHYVLFSLSIGVVALIILEVVAKVLN